MVFPFLSWKKIIWILLNLNLIQLFLLYIIITDEGSFSCSLLSNSSGFRFIYILTQKWVANKYVI